MKLLVKTMTLACLLLTGLTAHAIQQNISVRTVRLDDWLAEGTLSFVGQENQSAGNSVIWQPVGTLGTDRFWRNSKTNSLWAIPKTSIEEFYDQAENRCSSIKVSGLQFDLPSRAQLNEAADSGIGSLLDVRPLREAKEQSSLAYLWTNTRFYNPLYCPVCVEKYLVGLKLNTAEQNRARRIDPNSTVVYSVNDMHGDYQHSDYRGVESKNHSVCVARSR